MADNFSLLFGLDTPLVPGRTVGHVCFEAEIDGHKHSTTGETLNEGSRRDNGDAFISFWRAAAIVLNDLGSSAYYAGGIAEQAVGHTAPWFILGVMLFSYAVRAVYIESCAMFTRGGVYRVVKEAMGGTLAKLSVSALMFDYILTGPISGVSAGQYVVKLAAQTATYFGFFRNHPRQPLICWLPVSQCSSRSTSGGVIRKEFTSRRQMPYGSCL
jgi:amino acid transporter